MAIKISDRSYNDLEKDEEYMDAIRAAAFLGDGWKPQDVISLFYRQHVSGVKCSPPYGPMGLRVFIKVDSLITFKKASPNPPKRRKTPAKSVQGRLSKTQRLINPEVTDVVLSIKKDLWEQVVAAGDLVGIDPNDVVVGVLKKKFSGRVVITKG